MVIKRFLSGIILSALLLNYAHAEASGRLADETRFANTVFAADTPLKAYYRYNRLNSG